MSQVYFIAIFALSAGVCFALAYLIGVRRHMHLIAGYDPARTADNAGLARLTARALVAIGVFTLALPVAILAAPGAFPIIFGGYLGVVLGASAFLAARAGRYLRRPRRGSAGSR